MTDVIHREVAGINFDIFCDKSIDLYEPSSAYEHFLRRGHNGAAAVHTKIYLTLEEMPGTEKLTKIFDSGHSLSMLRDGDTYLLRFHPPVFVQPLWVASIKRDFTEVTVYCSNKLVSYTNGKAMISNPVHYPLDQILLMYILGQSQGALLHAAGINVNGKGCIFAGRSGAGKSTITRQFAARKDIGLLSDDRIAVRRIAGAFKAFGTPWPGEARLALNKNVPLSGIFFIHRGSANRIKDVTPQKALEKIFPVTSIPWYDQEIIPRMLSFCGDLVSYVPAYELHFKPSIEVVDVLEKFVST